MLKVRSSARSTTYEVRTGNQDIGRQDTPNEKEKRERSGEDIPSDSHISAELTCIRKPAATSHAINCCSYRDLLDPLTAVQTAPSVPIRCN